MVDQPTDYSSIDSFQVGRRRKPNFTDQEVLTIVDQYDKYKEYLHSREASKSVIAQKQAIWKQITDKLNATYPQVERTVEDVRRKWKKLQSEAKREAAAVRAAREAGNSPSISQKQFTLYNRILAICRPSPGSSSHFPHSGLLNHSLDVQNPHHSSLNLAFNDQSSDKADSPGSDLVIGTTGQMDSPADESPSLLDQNENSNSPKTDSITVPSTNPTFMNGQISRRTWEKRRKLLKPPVVFSQPNKSYGQQQNSLRLEALHKRRRVLELTTQRLINDKERLNLERKSLEVQFAMNESEHERIIIEKRRVDLAIQKLQTDLSMGINEVNQTSLSDAEDHDDNQSYDPMNDIDD